MKIRGYTLIETMVVFVLSAFTIALIINIYFIVIRQFEIIKSNSNINNEVLFAGKIIRKDIEDAEYLIVEGNSFICKSYNYDEKRYYLNENNIVRKTSISEDTLLVPIISFKTFFNKEQINNGIIDLIIIKVKDKNSFFSLGFSKDYALDKLIEINNKINVY
ncbi:MAG: hypothetical protein A2X12_05505 [Bacteroidetes bacterium GWE2_29_8]|nr:MAG: hypothetical protein A2X12_05505 [Bacteroidetes bacterium GWE2_29_8]